MSKNINRRLFCKQIGLGTGAIGLASCKSSNKQKPNILFVFADQLRAQALSTYGNKNIYTPNIDRLAREGIRFTHAVAQCPLCTPYRGTLMSGLYPTHSGIVINKVRAHFGFNYIAKSFQDNGYHTGFIGKWHLYTQNPKAETDSDFIPPGPDRLGFEHWEAYNYMHTYNDGFFYRDKPEKLKMNSFETNFETDLAIQFMQEQKTKSEPFFLVMAPHPPHPPFGKWNCPPGYWDKVKKPFDWSPNVTHPDQWEEQLHGYYAMVKNLDDNMGRILNFLDQSGLADNTIMVLTADHGEMMGSHGLKGKMKPYAESCKVPLIMRGPGHIPKGRITDELYSSIDHYPTLCSLAGIEYPDDLDGQDVSQSWKNPSIYDRSAVFMANYSASKNSFKTGPAKPNSGDSIEWRAVKTKDYTYVKWIDGTEALYNDQQDPYQLNDLAKSKSHQTRLEQMRNALQRFLKDAHDDFKPGTYYAGWYDQARTRLKKTGRGPV